MSQPLKSAVPFPRIQKFRSDVGPSASYIIYPAAVFRKGNDYVNYLIYNGDCGMWCMMTNVSGNIVCGFSIKTHFTEDEWPEVIFRDFYSFLQNRTFLDFQEVKRQSSFSKKIQLDVENNYSKMTNLLVCGRTDTRENRCRSTQKGVMLR